MYSVCYQELLTELSIISMTTIFTKFPGVSSYVSSERPQFISSGLDTITMKYHVPGVTGIAHTVQIWSNTTEKWRDARCIQSSVTDSCVVTNLNKSVTVTGLSPAHAYYVRFASPTQVFGQVSEAMETKQLGNYTQVATPYRNVNYASPRPIQSIERASWHGSGFYSMKRQGTLLLPPGWDASPSQGTQHEATRSITIPPGWDASPSQGTQYKATWNITSPLWMGC